MSFWSCSEGVKSMKKDTCCFKIVREKQTALKKTLGRNDGFPMVCRSATSLSQKKKGERRHFSKVSWVANGKLPPSLKSITPPNPPQKKKQQHRLDAGWVLLGTRWLCFVGLLFLILIGCFCPKWLAIASMSSVPPSSRAPTFGYSSLCLNRISHWYYGFVPCSSAMAIRGEVHVKSMVWHPKFPSTMVGMWFAHLSAKSWGKQMDVREWGQASIHS